MAAGSTIQGSGVGAAGTEPLHAGPSTPMNSHAPRRDARWGSWERNPCVGVPPWLGVKSAGRLPKMRKRPQPGEFLPIHRPVLFPLLAPVDARRSAAQFEPAARLRAKPHRERDLRTKRRVRPSGLGGAFVTTGRRGDGTAAPLVPSAL